MRCRQCRSRMIRSRRYAVCLDCGRTINRDTKFIQPGSWWRPRPARGVA